MADSQRAETIGKLSLGAGVLAVLAMGVAFWVIIPSVLLGLAAVVLGVMARRAQSNAGRARDAALVAICLGAVAIIGTPWAVLIAMGSEDHGALCEREPSNEECE